MFVFVFVSVCDFHFLHASLNIWIVAVCLLDLCAFQMNKRLSTQFTIEMQPKQNRQNYALHFIKKAHQHSACCSVLQAVWTISFFEVHIFNIRRKYGIDKHIPNKRHYWFFFCSFISLTRTHVRIGSDPKEFRGVMLRIRKRPGEKPAAYTALYVISHNRKRWWAVNNNYNYIQYRP